MPTYAYTVFNTAGKQVRSRIEAASGETAKASLRSMGYVVLDIHPVRELDIDIDLPFLGRLPPKELALFCRQFGSIVRAGVPISSALEMMGQQERDRRLTEAMRGIQAEVEKGSTLAEGMARYPRVFPQMLLSMVDAGEQSGNLETVFFQMERYYEKAHETRNAIKGAMTYPAVLAVAMLLAAVVMMVKIIPMFTRVFESMSIELPPLTVAVIALSRWMGRWWWTLLLGGAAAAAGIGFFRRSLPGRRVFGLLAMKLPVVRDLAVRSACASFCRCLAMLQNSGMNLTDSLRLTAANMDNIWFREAVESALELVTRGISLATALRDTRLFPLMVYYMVGVGEETGDLASMLEKTAEYYDDEVRQATARLLALLQPVMIVVMAVFVVIFVMAIFLPIMKMTQAYDQYLN